MVLEEKHIYKWELVQCIHKYFQIFSQAYRISRTYKNTKKKHLIEKLS